MRAIIFVVTVTDIILLMTIAITILIMIGCAVYGGLLNIKGRRKSKKSNNEKFLKEPDR